MGPPPVFTEHDERDMNTLLHELAFKTLGFFNTFGRQPVNGLQDWQKFGAGVWAFEFLLCRLWHHIRAVCIVFHVFEQVLCSNVMNNSKNASMKLEAS